jgi:hypothetical protein
LFTFEPYVQISAVSALLALPAPLLTALALLMVAAIVALVAWALQLMQAANDRQEFSLMLAGCMVCSAAVGLATVMVLTFTSPVAFQSRWSLLMDSAAASSIDIQAVSSDGAVFDAIAVPWDGAANQPHTSG